MTESAYLTYSIHMGPLPHPVGKYSVSFFWRASLYCFIMSLPLKTTCHCHPTMAIQPFYKKSSARIFVYGKPPSPATSDIVDQQTCTKRSFKTDYLSTNKCLQICHEQKHPSWISVHNSTEKEIPQTHLRNCLGRTPPTWIGLAFEDVLGVV